MVHMLEGLKCTTNDGFHNEAVLFHIAASGHPFLDVALRGLVPAFDQLPTARLMGTGNLGAGSAETEDATTALEVGADLKGCRCKHCAAVPTFSVDNQAVSGPILL